MSDDETKPVEETTEAEPSADAPLSDEILNAFDAEAAAPVSEDDEVVLPYHPSKDGEETVDLDLGDEE